MRYHEVDSVDASKLERVYGSQPAGTIARQHRFKHLNHDRYLTVLDRTCVQLFPDNYLFVGTNAQMRNQIGNAVRINLAHAVGPELCILGYVGLVFCISAFVLNYFISSYI